MEGVGDSAGAVLDVDDCKIVPCEPRDLGDRGGERQKEYAIEYLAVLEARFEGCVGGRCDNGGREVGGGGSDWGQRSEVRAAGEGLRRDGREGPPEEGGER